MKQWKDNSWEEQDDQDDIAFLKLGKEIWKEFFSHSAQMLEAQEEEEQEVEEEQEMVGGGAIVLYDAYGNNDDEDGGSDMLVGLDEN